MSSVSKLLKELNKACEDLKHGELSEQFAMEPDAHLEPHILGQLLMNHLSCENVMETHDRVYWMNVGDQMGPDYIDAFRKAGAFMHKVDQF